eukprot:scaffold38801_cov54-Phaeocystis_antarctica.AAC.3
MSHAHAHAHVHRTTCRAACLLLGRPHQGLLSTCSALLLLLLLLLPGACACQGLAASAGRRAGYTRGRVREAAGKSTWQGGCRCWGWGWVWGKMEGLGCGIGGSG